MARYRIHRMREAVKEQFRWAPHTGGTAVVKPRDYDAAGELEAGTPYALWSIMKAQGEQLSPGDVLETIHEDGNAGELHIFKYIGFESAKWWIPEPKPEQRAKFDGVATPLASTADWNSV